MNSSRFAYLLVDGLCFIFPFILSFLRPFRFVEHGKHFLLAATITSIPFLIWDSIFTSLSVWWFSEKYTLPFRIFSLPIGRNLILFCHSVCLCFFLSRHKKIHSQTHFRQDDANNYDCSDCLHCISCLFKHRKILHILDLFLFKHFYIVFTLTQKIYTNVLLRYYVCVCLSHDDSFQRNINRRIYCAKSHCKL